MNKTFKALLVILLIIIAIIIIIMAVFGFVSKTHKPTALYNLMKGSNSDYVMVYVNNGSSATSYYGQLKEDEGGQIVLSNPGYIEVQQPATKDGQPTTTLRLMKDDFYKPIAELTLYKQNVIFIQKLSTDSPVVSAYKQLK